MKYYVIATLGSSPAVLTELLWALVVQEDADVVGLEVWTTSGNEFSGEIRLSNELIAKGGWERLKSALGERAERVPPLSLRSVPREAIAGEIEAGRRPFRLEVIKRDGECLADIRSPKDAEALDAELFERVRSLVKELPADVALLGSLAGGRKTMSAGLQSAFTLLARPKDRLVHVLMHPKLEVPEKGGGPKDFLVPEARFESEYDVPLTEQVNLHDVHFPLWAQLMEIAAHLKRPVLELLLNEEGTFAERMSMLRTACTVEPDKLTAHLKRADKGRKWTLSICLEKELLKTISLDERMAQVWLTIASAKHGDWIDAEEGLDWLEQHDLLDGDPKLTPYWNKQRERLNKALAELRVLGLSDFCVKSRTIGKFMQDQIPAAAANRIYYNLDDI